MCDYENRAMYETAKRICHEHGVPWYDPRTGKKYPPPRKVKNAKSKKRAGKSNRKSSNRTR